MQNEPEVEQRLETPCTVGAPFSEAFYADVFAENVAVGTASFKVGKRCLADGKLVLPVDGNGSMGGLLSSLSSREAETRALIDLDTTPSTESKWDVATDDKRTFAELDFAPGRYRIHQRKEDPERDKPTNSYRRIDLPIEQIPRWPFLLGYLRRWDPAPGKGFVHTTMGRYDPSRRRLHRRRAHQTPMGERNAVRIDGVGVRVSTRRSSRPARCPSCSRSGSRRTTHSAAARGANRSCRADHRRDPRHQGRDLQAAPVECQDRVDKLALASARRSHALARRRSDEAAPTQAEIAPRNVTRPGPTKQEARAYVAGDAG
jgi:hypothetical protein